MLPSPGNIDVEIRHTKEQQDPLWRVVQIPPQEAIGVQGPD